MIAAAFAMALLHGGRAGAQVLPDGPLLASADMREGQDLSGEWTYSIDPYRDGMAGFHGGAAGTGHRRYDDTDVEQARRADPPALYEYDMDRAPRATLPSSWLTHAPEMRHYQGLVWYQRRFDADPVAGERQFLRFGAVNYAAEVWLNGEFLGRHEGGFTPFAFEVTGKLRAEGNRLLVGADSIRDWQDVPPPVTDWETYGGITRPVSLIAVPETYVDDAWLRLTPDGRITMDIALDGPQAAGAPVEIAIPGLELRLTTNADPTGRVTFRITPPSGLERWSPQNPKLYDIEIRTGEDVWRDRVGFRTIAVRGSEVLLNGEPVFLSGISLHEEELGAQPTRNMTPAAARALLTIVRDDLNGNFVRLAHYPHGDAMVRAADELGLLVWSEIPVYWRIAFADPDVLTHARTMLSEMVLRDRNRASVVIWSVGNETPVDAPRNAFMAQLVADARTLDPHRLVSAALLTERDDSGEVPVMRLVDPLADHLDVLAVNTYNGWYGPDRPEDVPRIAWDVPAGRPLVFSEMGAGAQPGLHAAQGEEPIKFTEEYQATYYRNTLAMAEGIETLAGLSPWILKDFLSPRRQLPGVQDGWNRKGLIGPEGERKLAFDVLAEWYAEREE
ncbi:beta-glucuronidase [Alteraurantiacibacter aquimixticola]|uniref:Beta-glucuronidase n=2 Tax=Alteraurantiacibacter aquimixticola TaxID=2489173 RepID=A0A4T3F341_9SPHN|nr:beta-glucuronidase [Alteraurantiacibacter aquimixticola]